MSEDKKNNGEVDPSEAYESVKRKAKEKGTELLDKTKEKASGVAGVVVEIGKRKVGEVMENAIAEGIQAATDPNYLTNKQKEMTAKAEERGKKIADTMTDLGKKAGELENRIDSELENAEKEIAEKGVSGYATGLLGRIAKTSYDKFVGLAKESLAPAAQLRVDGFDSIMGVDRAKYSLPDSDITRPQAEAVSYFVTELAKDRSALPYNLGAGNGNNSAVRKQILEHMISFATTNAEELLGCLKEIMEYGIESNVAPEMLELEISALDRYKENIIEKEKKLFER